MMTSTALSSNFCSTDRLKKEFVIICEVEVFPTGTRVAQFTKTFVAERCLNMQEAFVKSIDTTEGVKQKFYLPRIHPKKCQSGLESAC